MILADEQVKQAGQFGCGRDGHVRLLGSGEQMKSVAIRGHQPIQKRNVHAMEVLQGVYDRELRAQIQLQGSVADRSEIHQGNAPVGFLQSDGRVYGCGGSADAAFGIEKRKDTRLARTALGTAQRGSKTSESLDQRFGAGGPIDKFTSPSAHRGNDDHGLVYFPGGKNCDVGNAGMDQLNGADGALRILWIDIDQNDFGVLVLQLTQ